MKKEIIILFLLMFVSSCTLNNDKNSKDGLVIRKRSDGTIHYMNYYKNGLVEGASMSFHDNGKLYTFGYYINDSILHGPGLIFFRDGKVNVYDNYLNGIKEGVSVFYNEKGVLIDKEYYRNGVRDGEQYYFKDNGDTLRVDYYEKGVLRY